MLKQLIYEYKLRDSPMMLSSNKEDISPFNTEWLSQQFSFNMDTVESASWDKLINALYEVRFKTTKDANDFFKTLEQAQCFPRLFNNTVILNKHTGPQIIKAAAERSLTLKVQDNDKQHSVKMLQAVTVSGEKQEINPFDKDWLYQHFDLDIDKVVSAGWDKMIGTMYQIKFKSLQDAKLFFQKMDKAQCNPQIWDFSNTVELNKYSKDRILKAAAQSITSQEEKSSVVLNASYPNFFPQISASDTEKELRMDYILPSKAKVSKHVNLALRAENEQAFIKHWIHAFKFSASSAITMHQEDMADREAHKGVRTFRYDCLEERILLDCFEAGLYKEGIRTRLNNVFLHVHNWEEFYNSISDIPKEHIIQFVNFIKTIKDTSNHYVFHTKIAEACLYQEPNHYMPTLSPENHPLKNTT